MSTRDNSPNTSTENEIREVWASNLEEEFSKMSKLIDTYNYVAMDTEYPGICVEYNGNLSDEEAGYKYIKDNVNVLKLIQIGLTFTDQNGDSPNSCSTWQFNFRFNLKKDRNLPESINMLKDAGIDFDLLENLGIEPLHFWELLISSGLVLNDEVTWIAFHGSFDFTYLLRGLINEPLPLTLKGFNHLVYSFFPNIYDLKMILSEVQELKNGSLQKLSMDLDIKRTGTQHQAGSDSHLTSTAFHVLKKDFMSHNKANEKTKNKIWGISNKTVYMKVNAAIYANMQSQKMSSATTDHNYMVNIHNQFYNPMFENRYLNQFENGRTNGFYYQQSLNQSPLYYNQNFKGVSTDYTGVGKQTKNNHPLQMNLYN